MKRIEAIVQSEVSKQVVNAVRKAVKEKRQSRKNHEFA